MEIYSVLAEKLYKRAIEEGKNTEKISNFAMFLTNGAKGVVRAVHLYRKEIVEGN